MHKDIPLNIPPGVVRGATISESVGRWYDSQLVRWNQGVMQPIKGWEQLSVGATASTIRATRSWTDNSGVTRVAVLCDAHLYVVEGNAITDISPVVPIVAPSSDPLAGGYGMSDYNEGDYNTPRPERERARIVGPAFTLGNWGEDLLAMTSIDGRLLKWSPGDANAAPVTEAPTPSRTFVVTSQRHVMLFGLSGNSQAFGWCNQEDLTDWNFASLTSSAGSFNIEPSSPIICAAPIRGGVIMFTALKAYFIQFIGLPFVFRYDEIADSVTPISPAALVSYSDKAAWMSESGFWVFDGGSIYPMPCDVLNWVSGRRDERFARIRTIGAVVNSANEVWWLFPSTGQTENDSLVVWNMIEGWWSIGRLSRSAGIPSSYNTSPLMASGTTLYFHERGSIYPGAALPYAETASISPGSPKTTLHQLISDHGGNTDVRYTFYTKQDRMKSTEEKIVGPKAPRSDGYVDARITGRDIRIRIASAAQGSKPWTFGQPLMRITRSGSK